MRPRSPVCSQPSAASDRRATAGPAHLDLALLDPNPGTEDRAAGGPQVIERLAGPEDRHLRAGLGQPVGLHHRGPASERLLQQLARQRARRRSTIARGRERSAPASSRRLSWVATSETPVIPSSASGGGDAVGVEAVVDHGAGAVDRRAGQDRETADVKQRHAAEPAIAGLDSRSRAPMPRALAEKLPVDELDLPAGVPEVPLVRMRATTGSAPGAGSPRRRSPRPETLRGSSRPLASMTSAGSASLDDARALALGEPGVQRQGGRPELSQRVEARSRTRVPDGRLEDDHITTSNAGFARARRRGPATAERRARRR